MSFGTALEFVLQNEGGWYPGNQARDPNPTMQGITQATYDAWRGQRGLEQRSVQFIERAELEAIYRNYWNAIRGDELPPLTGITLFDHAVNAGPTQAIKILQKACGAEVDGVLGPKTLEAVRALADRTLALRVSAARLKFYNRLALSPRLLPNLRSWVDRTARFLVEQLAG